MMLLAGAVIIAGSGYLLFSNSNDSEGTGEAMNQQAPEESGTFASMMASGKNLECSFEYNDGGTNVSSGVVYMTKGAKQIRGDFNFQQSGLGAMDVYLIRNDGYNYIWGTSLPQGIKSKITAEDGIKLFDTTEGPGVAENTTFYCENWNVDQSKFALPSGVEFMDLSAQVEAATGASTGSMGGMKDVQCAACNQLPAGGGREQCLAALSCN